MLGLGFLGYKQCVELALNGLMDEFNTYRHGEAPVNVWMWKNA